jgi:HAD superfamily hydrolase (TIGR01509 family)
MIPKAVFFDMDGTLIDSEPLWFENEVKLMAQFDYEWGALDQSNTIGGPIEKVGKYMSACVLGVNTPEFFAESLISMVSSDFESRLVFMPGALELLHSLSEIGMKLALVSASPRQMLEATFRRLEGKYFELLVSKDDVVNPKPDPECYLKAAEFFGVSPSDCLILEDSLTGVLSAKASGAKVVAIPHFVEILADDQVVVIATLKAMKLESLFSLH